MTTTQPSPALQPAPALPPAPPAPPAAPGSLVALAPISLDVALPAPRTGQELAAIRHHRSELSDQLTSAASRREAIARELRRSGVAGADREGLEERLRILDQRIVRLEADIALTGRQITSAPASLVASARVSESFGGLPAGGVVAMGLAFNLFVLAPLAFAMARRIWRRGVVAPPRAAVDDGARFARLETAVDAIAEEMERVSEGQRFVTRLLAETHGIPQYAAGQVGAPARAPYGAGEVGER